jgi:hypothetical protein
MIDAGDEHLDDIALAELLDGTGDLEANRARVAHIAHCTDCRAGLAELEGIVRDPSVRAELQRPEWRARPATVVLPTRRRSARVLVGSLAAAALLLFGVRAMTSRGIANDDALRLRHATISTAVAPRLVTPTLIAGLVDSLTWTAVPRADRYRITVFDASGGVAWEAEVSDTSVGVPREIAAKWSGQLRWRVKARTSFDRWVDSEFGEFSIPGVSK